jgi:hypothetical protein
MRSHCGKNSQDERADKNNHLLIPQSDKCLEEQEYCGQSGGNNHLGI